MLPSRRRAQRRENIRNLADRHLPDMSSIDCGWSRALSALSHSASRRPAEGEASGRTREVIATRPKHNVRSCERSPMPGLRASGNPGRPLVQVLSLASQQVRSMGPRLVDVGHLA